MPRRNVIEIKLIATDNASKHVNVLSTSLSKLAKNALGIGALAGAVVGLVRLTKTIEDLISRAAEIEGVERAFISLSASIGKSADEMLNALRESSAGMISNLDLMRSFNMATQLISRQFAGELPEALQYLTKVSVATGLSMNYLMDSLVKGIGRLQPRIIDNLGVQLDMNAAYQEWADANDRNVKSMTKVEQQAAAYAKVLQLLERNTAALPDVTDTLAFQFSRLKGNLINTKDEVLRGMVPAFVTLVKVGNQLIEGPLSVLVDILVLRVAPAIDVVIEKFGKLAQKVVDSSGVMEEDFLDTLTSMAWDAAVWGNRMMINFADGMIRGIATAVGAAIRFLSSLVTKWLKPGSPPRFAPRLDEWGAEAFTEYLRGFTNASFDVLEGLQDPLQRILRNLTDSGEIAEEAAGKIFATFSRGMASAIPEMMRTGRITDEIFSLMQQSAMGYSDEMVELLKRQIGLAKAVDDLRIAEEALAASRKKHNEAEQRIRALAKEYNELLRVGASKDILRARQKEFRAARDSLYVAREQIRAAEFDKEEAEGRVDVLKEQLRLQERLLNQLIEISQALKPPTEPAGKKGKEVFELPEIEVPELPTDIDLSGGLDQAFQDARDKIEAGIDELIRPWREKWENDWKPIIDEIKGDFQTLVDDIVRFLGPLTGEGGSMDFSGFLENIAFAVGALAGLRLAASLAGLALQMMGGPKMLLVAAGLAILKTAWENDWFGMRTVITDFWTNDALPFFQDIQDWIETQLPQKLEDLRKSWGKTFDRISTDVKSEGPKIAKQVGVPIAAGVGASLVAAIGLVGVPFLQGLGGFLAYAIPNALATVGPSLLATLGGAFAAITAAINPIVLAIAGIGLVVGLVTAAWINDWGGIRTFITTLWDEKLLPFFTGIGEWFETKIPQAIETVSTFFTETLGPAIDKVWTKIKEFFQPAIEAVSNFIDTKLVPALKSMWEWYSDYINPILEKVVEVVRDHVLPYFRELADFFKTAVNFSLRVVKGQLYLLWSIFKHIVTWWIDKGKAMWDGLVAVFEEHVLPVLKNLYEMIRDEVLTSWQDVVAYYDQYIKPMFDTLVKIWKEDVVPQLERLRDMLQDLVTNGWQKLKDIMTDIKDGVMSAIIGVLESIGQKFDVWRERVQKVKDALAGFQLPAWMTPGSPTPLEIGLDGINRAMKDLSRQGMPQFNTGLENLRLSRQEPRRETMSQTEYNYYFSQTVNTPASQPDIMRDFNMARALYGR